MCKEKNYCLKIFWLFTVSVSILSFTSCNFEKLSDNDVSIRGNLNDYKLNHLLYFPNTGNESDNRGFDLDRIKKRGKLIALTGYSPTGYFIYKGTPIGFQHDLLKLLGKELQVEIEIVIVNDINEIIDKLNRGEGDLIADNLIITKDMDAMVDFTDPLLTTRQVLVQQKIENKNLSSARKIIRNPIDLIGKRVHVCRDSPFHSRLKNLSEEIGGDIKIVLENGKIQTEELITMVSQGKIPYTVADENVASIQESYYSNIDIQTAISFEQRIGWAVRENSPELLKSVNAWIKKTKNGAAFTRIYNKYYLTGRRTDGVLLCDKDSKCRRNISKYDDLIIQHAKEIGWDWRLLAALIYQESRFNPRAKSWAGACGLMQLMPGTAENFGAGNLEDPCESIKAGTKYLKWLEKYWEKKVSDKNERLKFIMASYNVGQEHVADAQRLTSKYNKNPEIWDDNVAYFILQKSKHQYCSDPVVKYGYCRGQEPFDYVKNILERYEHYKKLIAEDGLQGEAEAKIK